MKIIRNIGEKDAVEIHNGNPAASRENLVQENMNCGFMAVMMEDQNKRISIPQQLEPPAASTLWKGKSDGKSNLEITQNLH